MDCSTVHMLRQKIKRLEDGLEAIYEMADEYIEESADALEVDPDARPVPQFVYRVRKRAAHALERRPR